MATLLQYVDGWLAENTSAEFRALVNANEDALTYLWQRHTFVSASPANLYWLTFFDDLWTNNFEARRPQPAVPRRISHAASHTL